MCILMHVHTCTYVTYSYVFGLTLVQLGLETGISTFLKMEVPHLPHLIMRMSQPLIVPPSVYVMTSTSTSNRKSFSVMALILMNLDWGFPHLHHVPLPSGDPQGTSLRQLNPRERKRQSLSIRSSLSFRRPVSPSTLLEERWRNSWIGNFVST